MKNIVIFALIIFTISLITISSTPSSYGALTDNVTHSVSLNSINNALYGFEFSPDGNNAYFTYGPETYDSRVVVILVHYELSSPYDISTRNELSRFAFPENGDPNADGIINPYSFSISDNGEFLYIFSFSNSTQNSGDERILQYRLTTPFVLSTAEFVRNIDYSDSGNYHILHVDFNPDGTILYTADFYTNNLSQYNLDSPFEISFDNLTTSIDTGTTFLIPELSHDGNLLFIDNFPHIFRIYDLDTPFQLSSVSNGTAITPDLPANQTSGFFLSDFHWYNDGLNMFIKSSSSPLLFQYTFDRPYDFLSIPQEDNTSPQSISPPTVVVNNVSLLSEPRGSGGCSGDCTYPTIGLDRYGNRLVENGFSYNDNTINAVDFHTPYPLITTETYKINELKVKAWDNTTIRLIQLGFGLPEIGLPSSDAAVLVEVWFEPYSSNIEELKITDPHDLIKYPLISAKSKMVDCRTGNDAQCIELTLNYVYDNIPKYSIVKVDVMDFARNVQSTIFNDGIEIFGTVINDNPKKMTVPNPPKDYPSKYQAEISKVGNTNDLWIDKYGYHWVGDESKIQLVDDIQFIRHQDKQSNFGSQDRSNSNFEKMVQYEKQRAQNTLEELYGNPNKK